MMTLSQLTRQAAASLTAARLIQKEIENLMCSPIGTPQQEAAKNARISALKHASRH